MCAAQGLSLLLPLQPSEPLKLAFEVIRDGVPQLEDDRPLHSDITRIREMLTSESIVASVEKITGPLLDG
jgi:histidine ammonia-lyase